jgi:hypothetical protein
MTKDRTEDRDQIWIDDCIDDVDRALNPIGRSFRHNAMHAGTTRMPAPARRELRGRLRQHPDRNCTDTEIPPDISLQWCKLPSAVPLRVSNSFCLSSDMALSLFLLRLGGTTGGTPRVDIGAFETARIAREQD